MNQQKGLLTHVGEALDHYRAERHATAQPRRWRWLGRQLMPNIGTLLMVAVLILTQNVWARQAAGPASPGPSATTVNYQGRLSDSDGAPLDGTYGMSFALYDAATDGNLVWGPEEHTAVEVSDGLFSVGLGSKTSGGIPTTTWNGDRYLEITVGGETLEPRELIRSVPIAGMALTVPDGAITNDKLARPLSNVVLLNEPPYTLYEIPATTNDGNWHTVDISSKVPSGATGVILQIGISSSEDAALRVAPYGHEQLDYMSAKANGSWTFNQGMVSLVDGKISYQTESTTEKFWIRLIGYIE
jgi:hypothetical protein